MVRTAARTVVAVLAGVTAASMTEDDISLVQSAIAKTGTEAHESCAYSSWRDDGERVIEERYDPEAEDPWRLVAVDGVAPSADEIDDYRPDGRGTHPASLDFESLEFDEFWPIETDAAQAVFGFVPKDEDGDEIDEVVRGRLTIATGTADLTSMEVTASEPFSPAAFVKMHEFWQRFDLGYDDEVGAVVMQRMDMRIKGKAMGLKKIDVAFNLRFGQFDCP